MSGQPVNAGARVKGRKGHMAGAGLSRYADVVVRAALAEDIGSGDITTKAIVPDAMRAECVILAKEDLVLAGLFAAEKAFKQLDPKCRFLPRFQDGTFVKKGKTVVAISGRLSPMLSAERVALNFLQRLSGIATLTREFVKRTAGTKAKILDTRKTTPCLRMFERYAVRAGGGGNHRFGLFDCILVKDNHIKAAGGVKKAVDAANARCGRGAAIEVEVTSLKEVGEAVLSGTEIIMLDNMSIEMMRKAVKLINGTALTEASGGVTLENVEAVAKTGVDFISVGGLTHSAMASDISMEVRSYAIKRRRGA